MRKLFLLCFSVLIFISCDFNGDDTNSVPHTDNSLFVKENSVIFPIGTTALEIYNCVYEKNGLGDFTVSGTYTHTETAILNGKEYTDTIVKNIVKVKVYKEHTENTHLFHCDFITESNEVLPFYYQWQNHNTNAWHNNKTDGEVIILF